ncbi:MAG: DNA-directed RNA polymerase subunit D [Candidatus Micrarchaeota archaeon]
MKVAIEKEHENRLEFSVEGITPTFANAIRRYAIARVPIIAIDQVTFYENSSYVFDEYLAHRVGQLPLKTPDKLSENAEITLSLDATGPKLVSSKDLKSSDSQIVVVKDNVPIISLNEGQRLQFEGKAIVGRGRTHAKFQSGIVAYGIDEKTGKISFKVEGFYQMPIKELVIRACTQLEDDLVEMTKFLKKKSK